MFIICVPHLVILDTLKDPALAQDVYNHIRTVDATPVIIVGTIDEIADEATRTVPACTPLSTMAFLARELVERYPRRF
jgi:hypothetical protein